MGFPILEIFGVVGKIIDKVIPDPQERARLQLELANLADKENQRLHEEMIAQADINKIEAGHRSLFVAGWRPFIGWGCGAAFLYNVLLAPAFTLPVADLSFLQTVLMAMLGIGAMRSYDKAKGTANDVLPVFPKVIDALPVPPKAKKGLEKLWPF